MDSLERLLETAKADHGGSRRAAAFLLSLWNGNEFKVDLQELLYIDAQPHADMVSVFTHLYQTNQQLDSLVDESEMKPIIRAWGNAFKSADSDVDYSELK